MKLSTLALIFDDHAGVRRGLSEWFRQYAPYIEVIEAASGEEAVACAAERSPDVVLIDVDLPGIETFETTRKLRPGRPVLPVIILTFHDMQEYRIEAAKAGTSASIVKQLAAQELLQVVKELVPGGFTRTRGHDA